MNFRQARRALCALTLFLSLPLSFRSEAEETGVGSNATVTYQLPAARRVVLPNGLTVLLVEKHELPLCSLTLALRTGSLLDPAGKPAVSALTAELLRKGTQGPAGAQTADQISNQLDFLGMTFAANGEAPEDTTVNADFLARDTDRALALVADIVLHPVFPAAEVTKAIAQRQERLRNEKDNVQLATANYFLATLYAGHPYSRGLTATEASLGAISRDDLLAEYHRAYTPPNAVLAIVGDFRSDAMEARLRKLFGGWTGAAPAAVKVEALRPVTGRHVLLVDKPDATQTYFIVGNVGVSETDPDRAPVEVVNTLFGGRFTSMFNDELRIKSGYSYGANSRFQQFRTPGPFAMSTFTRNATTGPAIDKTFEVVDRLRTHPFDEGTLQSAKAYLRGTFPPTLETGPALARRLALNEVEGVSREQFNSELAAEQTMTLADANRVIDKDFLTHDNYVLVMVGKASEIATIAAKYGTVTTVKITDPGYSGAVGALRSNNSQRFEPASFQVQSPQAPTEPPQQTSESGEPIRRIGGDVTPPVVLKAPAPKFSREARSARVDGDVLVYLRVDAKGRPTHVHVIKSLGYGLDEKAVEAVSKYKFKPAMDHDQPVEVEMNVSVHFLIY